MKLYALSDQHGKLDFALPTDADLILHAGDICPDFAPGSSWGEDKQSFWLKNSWSEWVGEAPLLYTFGNHDFLASYNTPEGRLKPVLDQLVEINGLKIWFSPWSNIFGGWAWMQIPKLLGQFYSAIPAGTDIIVSHQPPYGYGDQVPDYLRIGRDDLENDGHVGSKELLDAIDRVRPKAVICGHIHSGYGKYEHMLPCLTCNGSGMLAYRNGFDLIGEMCHDCVNHSTVIYNCSLVDEQYQRVNPVTEIIL